MALITICSLNDWLLPKVCLGLLDGDLVLPDCAGSRGIQDGYSWFASLICRENLLDAHDITVNRRVVRGIPEDECVPWVPKFGMLKGLVIIYFTLLIGVISD